LFLGKGGSSIQKLRADFSRTTIQVPDCASPERVLVINGDNDQCFEALYQIVPVLTDSSRLSSFNRRRTANGNQEANPTMNDNQTTGDIPSEIRLLVHQIYCGAIIGKGGQHVKELRQAYNLDIKVFSHCCPMSHERVISLRGKVEEIIECIKVIRKRTNQSTKYVFFVFLLHSISTFIR
jgi:predicted PilT family ATPase